MLRFLRISRLAVIDTAEVEFQPGLNVLTGETGAGKSILVGAVGLLLGDRASGDMVRTGEDSATVEAIFEAPDGGEWLIRREITSQGRSRAYVNGALVTASALKDLARTLIELHGQHEHQTLLDPATHLRILDDFGSLEPLVEPVRSAYQRWREVADTLNRARDAARQRDARLEFARFQLAELDKANPQPGEDERLLAVRQVLANADRLERLCAASYSALYERDGSIVDELGTVWRQVEELASIEPEFQPYLESRESIKSQLEDLAMFLRRYADRIESSPAKLEETEARLALLERLKRKYGPELSDVIARRTALSQEVSDLERAEETVAGLEGDLRRAEGDYMTAASALSVARREVAVRFARALEGELRALAMEATRVEVRFAEGVPPSERWTPGGIDAAEFFISANPGEDLRPLVRIVSGGELSRIMLGIKTLAAVSRPAGGSAVPPGLVFDEVDAGIGGRVADVVGLKLADLGRRFQVLCITHLPQIAAYAGTHFRITKSVERGRTHTTVVRLDPEGRVEEIGRMLGGAVVTEGIRASARELLTRCQEEKAKGERAKAKVRQGAKAKGGTSGEWRTEVSD